MDDALDAINSNMKEREERLRKKDLKDWEFQKMKQKKIKALPNPFILGESWHPVKLGPEKRLPFTLCSTGIRGHVYCTHHMSQKSNHKRIENSQILGANSDGQAKLKEWGQQIDMLHQRPRSNKRAFIPSFL